MIDPNPSGLCMCGCGAPVRVARRTTNAIGLVKGGHVRFLNGHGQRLSPVDYIEEDRGYLTPCWVWQLTTTPEGYGSKWDGSRLAKAHRWYYEQSGGVIPEGMQLDHLCRVRSCCNPAHVEPVTSAENTRRGERAKLTAADVAEMHRLRLEGIPVHEIADRFGIIKEYASAILRGVYWKNYAANLPALMAVQDELLRGAIS